ncbi:MAG TPA: ferritin-like domain-containing protein [Polyangiaceae bacterium]
MNRLDLRARILLAIGAGGLVVACGSSDSTGQGAGKDASSSGDATADAAGGASDAGEASADAAGDGGDAAAATDAPVDAGPDRISVRRPFLVGSSLRVAPSVERDDWELVAELDAAALDAVTARALAEAWGHDGCEEHASIAAFARFTMHLLAVGAPPDMVVQSQRASLDEVEHARACFLLARRYGGRAVGPAPLSLEGALAPATLVEMAALTAEEGCVGETLGVLLAREQLARTRDACVRRLLVRANIVADEEQHAELAWRFVAWAIARGGEPVRQAVAAAIRRAVEATLATPVRRYAGVDVDAWRAHGRLTCEDARAVARRGIRELVLPSAAAMLGASAASALHRPGATLAV